jgi:hypothetical protein
MAVVGEVLGRIAWSSVNKRLAKVKWETASDWSSKFWGIYEED